MIFDGPVVSGGVLPVLLFDYIVIVMTEGNTAIRGFSRKDSAITFCRSAAKFGQAAWFERQALMEGEE